MSGSGASCAHLHERNHSLRVGGAWREATEGEGGVKPRSFSWTATCSGSGEHPASENATTTDRATLLHMVQEENPEAETRWYFKFFLAKQHHIFIGSVADSEEDTGIR